MRVRVVMSAASPVSMREIVLWGTPDLCCNCFWVKPWLLRMCRNRSGNVATTTLCQVSCARWEGAHAAGAVYDTLHEAGRCAGNFR